MKVGKSKFYDLTATQEIEKEVGSLKGDEESLNEDEGSFFAGGPGAKEEIASSAEASPGPVKRVSADTNIALQRGSEHGAELPGMYGSQTILFQLNVPV